jgi:hypothetical protein
MDMDVLIFKQGRTVSVVINSDDFTTTEQEGLQRAFTSWSSLNSSSGGACTEVTFSITRGTTAPTGYSVDAPALYVIRGYASGSGAMTSRSGNLPYISTMTTTIDTTVHSLDTLGDQCPMS